VKRKRSVQRLNFFSKLHHPKFPRGFTLIELLVVIAVIGVLAASLFAFLNPGEQFAKAHDAQRKNDLKQITSVLEEYYNDNNSYPSDLSLIQGAYVSNDNILKDPVTKELYCYESDGSSYRLSTKLDRSSDSQAEVIPDIACTGNNYAITSTNTSVIGYGGPTETPAPPGATSTPALTPTSTPILTPTSTPVLTPTLTPTPTLPPCSNTWVQKANFPGVGTSPNVGFSIGNKGYVIVLGSYEYKMWEYDPSSTVNGYDANSNPKGQWTQKTTFTEPLHPSAGFSIGNKGYIETGPNSAVWNGTNVVWTYRGFYEYDQSSGSLVKKASFQNSADFTLQVGFSIGNKGYIGTGWGEDGVSLASFLEYDPASNVWTAKADIPARQDAVGFSIDTDSNGIPDKGYIGTGGNAGAWCTGAKSDFRMYNSGSNTWANRAPFGGGPRQNAVGFSIGNRGYIGTGDSSVLNSESEYDCVYFDDFWEYDPNSNSWTQKANFPGGKTQHAVGFSIGDKGYILNLNTKGFYEYCQ
jgi:prepilin-type N-terminal cleavage/methylation domain-containing protein